MPVETHIICWLYAETDEEHDVKTTNHLILNATRNKELVF